jgi:hypothetical protein
MLPDVRVFMRPGLTGELIYPSAPSTPALLTPADFTLLGYWNTSPQSLDSPFVQGFTHRYVNGQPVFLSIDNAGALFAQSFVGVPLGGRNDIVIGARPNTAPWGNRGVYNSLWWESGSTPERMWLTVAVDYTRDYIPSQLYTFALNPDASDIIPAGPFSLDGVPAKRAYGGVQPVPAWFQQQYGVGPYVTGFGGYTSLLVQGGGASLGLTAYAFANPTGPTVPCKGLADHGGAYGSDWYANGVPNGYDRGTRLTHPINYFDGGDPRENPPTQPIGAPLSTAQWLSPAPDGKGRFIWGDSYNNTGVWIDTPTKRGFVAIATLGMGNCWYGTSNLNYDSKAYELHIFDPADFGAVAQGTKAPWQVQPTSMTIIDLPGMGLGGQGGGTPPAPNTVVGASYDAITKRLYVLGTGAGGTYVNRIYVYQVNA